MKIKLTNEQKKHLKSIQWLYMGARKSGRTTLLAYVLIQTVLVTGQEMRIVDHYPDIRADKNLADIIDLIIKENELPLEITQSGLKLRPLTK
jgi:hypothetical protein